MDFTEKNNNFNYNYLTVKKIIKRAIKDLVFLTGSGGSNNLIIVDEDIAIKIIPRYYDKLLIKQTNNDLIEPLIYTKLTDEFIKTQQTPHIVGIYKIYILEDIKFILPSHCLTLDEYILKQNYDNKLSVLCDLKLRYDKNLVEKNAQAIILENCPSTISSDFSLLINKKMDFHIKLKKIGAFIDRIIFQFMFTMSIIQDKYPKFIHNDMFLRNILTVREIMNEPCDYVKYNYNNKSYYLPANGSYIKINDFGYALNILKEKSTLYETIDNTINSKFETDNQYRDVYTFLFDLYNGPNFGSQSLLTVINNNIKNKEHHKQIIKVFKSKIGKYFDYKTIDKIQKKDMETLDWIWSIKDSKILMHTIKKPKDYFKSGLFDNFTKLPDEGRIIKIYN